MTKLLLSILFALIIVGVVAALAVIAAKVSIAIGLIYLGIKVLKSLF